MSVKKINLTIATPVGEVYQGDVDQVSVTTEMGEITILPGHVALVAPLVLGQAVVKDNENEIYHAIDGGILEVRQNHEVVILANRAEKSTDIDIERSEKAIERARQVMSEETLDRDAYVTIEKNIERGLNRVRLAQKGGRK